MKDYFLIKSSLLKCFSHKTPSIRFFSTLLEAYFIVHRSKTILIATRLHFKKEKKIYLLETFSERLKSHHTNEIF